MGDSLVITVCFSAIDTTLQRDTIALVTDCYAQPIALVGQAAIPVIVAGNRDFGFVIVDSTKCDTVSMRNNGSALLILNNTFRLSNTINFSFPDSSRLPLVLQPGQVVYLTFCYTPHTKGIDTGVFYWVTNEVDPYKHSRKDSTILIGEGVKAGFLWDRTFQVTIGDSAMINDSTITRVYLLNNFRPGGPAVHVDSVYINGADANEFYILDNQRFVGSGTFGNFDLKASDTLWVDVVFKPDITKPYPQRYSDRHADLVASDSIHDVAVQKAQAIHFTGTWQRSGVAHPIEQRSFTIIPNPASGNSVIVALSDNITAKADLRIYDVLGREVYQKDLYTGTSRIEIPIGKLRDGVYCIQFTSDKGMKTEKFQVFR